MHKSIASHNQVSSDEPPCEKLAINIENNNFVKQCQNTSMQPTDAVKPG